MLDALRVVIVGGGITGLAAAHALEQQAGARPVDITLLEAADRLGGKLLSERVGDLLFEHGPDALFARKPGWQEFCRSVGLGDALVQASGEHRQAYILHRGRLHPLPPGTEAGIPRSSWALAGTALLSPLGKLRAGLEFLLPSGAPEGDESVDTLIRRRFGGEVAERIAGPLLGGVYTSDTRDLSLLATLPHLRQAERTHGSLLRAAWAAPAPGGNGGGAPQMAGSPFWSLRNGLEQLARATAERLAITRVRTATTVRCITLAADGSYDLELADGTSLGADRVVLATPAYAAAEMLARISPEAAQELSAIPYASVGVVGLAYAPNAASLPPGSGFIASSEEGRTVAACSWSSRKWPHVAPHGEVVLRCHLHADSHPALLERSERELVELVRAELRDLLNIRAEPLVARVARWPRGVASYRVGHLDKLERIEQRLQAFPGLVLAGAGYRGVGVPDCIRQGLEAAVVALGSLPPS